MKFATKILAAAAAIATIPSFAQASDQINGPYISLGGGLNIYTDPTFRVGGASFASSMENGYAGIAAFGWGYESGLRGELEIGHRNNSVDTIAGVPTRKEVTATSVMGNLLYDFDTGTALTPYIGLGLGAASVDANVAILGINDNDIVLAGQAIAGVNAALSDQLSLFGDYRYFRTQDPDFTGASSGEYEAHTFLVGLRWEFWETAAPEPEPVAAPVPQTQYMVFFDWDKSVLTDDARRILAAAADASKSQNVTRVAATGHADRSGSAAYNMGLSERRASAVKAELERLGVPSGNIVVRWKGETDPLVPTADGVREPQNRRVEIILQ